MLAAAPLEEEPATSHHSAPCWGLMCVRARTRVRGADTGGAVCIGSLF